MSEPIELIGTEEKLKELALKAVFEGNRLRLETEKHIRFLIRHLNVFPEAYNSLDSNRITLLFFAISSLDLLGELDNLLTPQRRKEYIDWIYQLQFSAATMFCEPNQRNFGTFWFGQRGFGGLLENHWRKNDEPKWIPQYNLSAFWRRDIAPIMVGYVEPLIKERKRPKLKINRLPGHLSHKNPNYQFDNRNLLAAKYFENVNNGIVKIWTVDERTKRKELEQFNVEIDENGCLTRRRNEGVEEEEEEADFKWDLSNTALELRCSKWNELNEAENIAVLIRTNKDLRIKKGAEAKISTIFSRSVRSFDENHWIPGELSLIDYGGMVWSSEEAGMMRVKVEEETKLFELISCCDHPRMIVLATENNARMLDTRMTGACTHLFESGKFEARGRHDSLYLHESPYSPQKIRHVQSIPNDPNHFLIMTDHSLFLIDDRFPKNAVLKMKYCIPAGGHHVIVSKAIKDQKGESTAIFVLDQLLTGISMLKLFRHESKVWSAVESLESIGSSNDYLSTIRRGKYVNCHEIDDEPTRAMALVEGMKNEILVLRQLDNGTIWWQKLLTKLISDEQKIEEEKTSWERVNDWIKNEKCGETEPMYVRNLDEELRQNLLENCAKIRVETKINEKLINKCWVKSENLANKTIDLVFEEKSDFERLEPIEKVNPQKTLSNIVIESWKAKVKEKMCLEQMIVEEEEEEEEEDEEKEEEEVEEVEEEEEDLEKNALTLL